MKTVFILALAVLTLMIGGAWVASKSGEEKTMDTENPEDLEGLETATFAGGCFWCMEAGFEEANGVVEAVSGYTGGSTENPTYEDVSTGRTGHYEAVRVYYDPEKISYSELLEVFWRNVNPTDPGGQFADRGSQYKTAIFYHSEEQRRLAEESKKTLDESGRFQDPVVTEILPLGPFYRAEEYHQDYYRKQAARFQTYERLSGREGFIEENWKDTE
jgi:peptide methionine sulfoxide reductase msrA/msrB